MVLQVEACKNHITPSLASCARRPLLTSRLPPPSLPRHDPTGAALGLVTGLATYGYNVTRAMGTRMAKLSPTRGFAAELSTALVILVASQASPFA
jgi:hypothetical protein